MAKDMKSRDLRAMSADQLWDLHEEVVVELTRKIGLEKAKLEERSRQITSAAAGSIENALRGRRPYPKVLPKYRNPQDHNETWAGRGKQPRWLRVQLRSGKKLDDFLIR
jgi:DNA-binding protein H-NS